MFYTGDKFPGMEGQHDGWQHDPGPREGSEWCGARVVFNDKMWESRRETILPELKQRMRIFGRAPMA
jgi:hypothetical protein